MHGPILIVDQDATIASTLLEVCHDEGYLACVASFGTAIAVAAQTYPHVLLLDVVGSLDHPGWTVLRQLEVHPRLAYLPVLCWSTSAEWVTQHMPACFSGTWHVLPKPCHLDLVVTAAIELGMERRAGARG